MGHIPSLSILRASQREKGPHLLQDLLPPAVLAYGICAEVLYKLLNVTVSPGDWELPKGGVHSIFRYPRTQHSVDTSGFSVPILCVCQSPLRTRSLEP